MHLRKETCYECEKHFRYMESSPAKQMGVTMHMGERFCTGGRTNLSAMIQRSMCQAGAQRESYRASCGSTASRARKTGCCTRGSAMTLAKRSLRRRTDMLCCMNCTRPSHPWSLQGDAMRNRTQKPLEQPFTGIMWLRSTTGSAPHSSTRRSAATDWSRCSMRRPQEKTNGRIRIESYRKTLRYLQRFLLRNRAKSKRREENGPLAALPQRRLQFPRLHA